MTNIIIVGSGIFGATAALELARRQHSITLLDPGPLPHPEAASTDISKVVRMDYGDDEFYTRLMEEGLQAWNHWNTQVDQPLYHETGFTIMAAKSDLEPGDFEYDSRTVLEKRGHTVEPLDSTRLKARFPAWAAENYPAGYFNPRAGWANSSAVVEQVVRWAKAEGVAVHEGQAMQHLIETNGRIGGVVTADGTRFEADLVIIAAGGWTSHLLPDLQDVMWPTGQPVFHFTPDNPADFTPPNFSVWAADVSNTGWYGFPIKPDGILKVANHGVGRRLNLGDPDEVREVTAEQEKWCREFLSRTFPAVADAPLVYTRLCYYCDTWDGHFWIDHHPTRPGLFVAAGGSGHGFKFASVLGTVIADIVERKPNPYAHRFAWRERGKDVKESSRASQ